VPPSTDRHELLRSEPYGVMLRPMGVRFYVGLAGLFLALSACRGADDAVVVHRPVAASPVPSAARTGPVPETASASCAEVYAPQAIGKRAVAFDGTITGTGAGTSNKVGKGALATKAVTFRVNEWWRGGTGGSVTVDMMSPGGTPQANDEQGVPYEVGTRLLVSGEPRWGGQPLDDAIAWGCGFTRYYDEATASSWRSATR
jgi:hypothetical protein